MRLIGRKSTRGLFEGLKFTEIGVQIRCDPLVVSREVSCHVVWFAYRTHAAQQAAALPRERPKPLAVDRHRRLSAVVRGMLVGGWSPASIAGPLPTDYSDDQPRRLSDEAMYTWVHAQRCRHWRGCLVPGLTETIDPPGLSDPADPGPPDQPGCEAGCVCPHR